MERYVSLRIQSKFGKMRTKITPNTGTFDAVVVPNVPARKYFHKLSKIAFKFLKIGCRLQFQYQFLFLHQSLIISYETFIYLFIIYLFIHLFIYLFIHLFIYLQLYLMLVRQ